MQRLIIGIILGSALSFTANLVSGWDGIWWLLIGVVTGAAVRSIDIKYNNQKDNQ